MDYFFSRFSHPHMSVENGIHFNGNTIDSNGKPYHIELTIDCEDNSPCFCELSITSPNQSWYSVSSLDCKWSYKLRKVNPLKKSKSKFTQLLSAEIIINSDFGSFHININDTMVSITEHIDIPF